ncbi:DUF664 domain-containing protein [Amycolatopsis sp. NPDC088138]|uniref:mycothiol transferase n=1 Tax=Amycolatopsis sp. NPDC088138 TaxID=3363938 RepID=UPI00382DEA8F
MRWIREAMLSKLDGLGEYDVRRPLTPTGTNLLGLIKHLATWESRYFGEVFGRPLPEPLPERGAPGHVPWWPSPEVTLFKVLVTFLTEINRHAGHADILREQLDGRRRQPIRPKPDQSARPGTCDQAS